MSLVYDEHKDEDGFLYVTYVDLIRSFVFDTGELLDLTSVFNPSGTQARIRLVL